MLKRGIAVVAALLGILSAAPSAPQAADNAVAWAKTWEDAKMEAVERNVPIFFTIQQDENPGSKQMEGAFRDGSFIAQSRRVVCVVANPDTKHGVREVMVNRQKVAFCRAYDGMTCETHTRCQSAMENFFKSGDFDIPSQVWCKPDGTELFKVTRFQGAPQSSAELLKDMERALDRVSGPKMNRKEWEDVKKLLRDADEAQGNSQYKIALQCYKKAMECKSEKFAKQAKERNENFIQSITNLVSRAIKQWEKSAKDSKEQKEAKTVLQKIAKEMKGTEAGDAADHALKNVVK